MKKQNWYVVSIKWILDPIFHSCKPNILGVLPVSCHINYFEIRLLSLKDMTFWSFFWPLAICRNNFHDYLLFSVWGWTFLILELTRSLCVPAAKKFWASHLYFVYHVASNCIQKRLWSVNWFLNEKQFSLFPLY